MDGRTYGLGLIGRREYSVHEFCEKVKKKFPEEDLEVMVLEFQEKDWLSDKRYCAAFIHQQKITTQAGPRVIYQKLKQKGVDTNRIKESLLEEFSREEQERFVKILRSKKRPFIKENNTKALKNE